MNQPNNFRALQEAYRSTVMEAETFKKFPKPIPLSGSNLVFYGIGRDANGNKTIKVGANGKGFTIQTLANVPTAHRIQMGDAPSEKELNSISSEINKYVKAFGSKNQKALMGESMVFHTADDVMKYVLSRWGVSSREELSSADRDRFDLEFKLVMASHPITSESNESDYKKLFNSILDQYGASSPAELSEKDKKEFFDKVDAALKAEEESDIDEAACNKKRKKVREQLGKVNVDDQTDVEITTVEEEEQDDESDDVEDKETENESVGSFKVGSYVMYTDDDGETYEVKIVGKTGSDYTVSYRGKTKRVSSTELSESLGKKKSNIKEEAPDEDEDDEDTLEVEANEDETLDEIEKEIDDEFSENIIKVGGKRLGLSQGMIRAFSKGADIVVKKVCNKCGFHMPAFSGRYPNACPLCGDDFTADDIEESFGAYKNGKCIGILTPIKSLKEGAFSEMDIDIQSIIDDFVRQRKAGEITSKDDLLKKIRALSMGKNIPKGVDPNIVKTNISDIAKGIADAFRKKGIKF